MEKFRQKLKNLVNFPIEYTFKIIGLNNGSFKADVEKVFEDKDLLLCSWGKSRTNKYISATIMVEILDEEELISYYKKIKNIQGLRYLL